MDRYVVVLHTHVGREYVVEAYSPDEAIEAAKRGYVEEGNDGEVIYESVEYTEADLINLTGEAEEN